MITKHRVNIGNSQNLEHVENESVNLIVTSPPYPMIEMWDEVFGSLNPAITDALNNENGFEAYDLMNKESDIEMNVSNCLNVEEIVIGNNCGKYITRFIISNLSKLRTIIIGSNSFTRLDYSSQSFLDNLGRIADENHIFIIQNCSSLEAITIGSHSFSDYYHFQLESKLFLTFFIIDLPSLVSLVIGTRSHSRRENYFSYNFLLPL